MKLSVFISLALFYFTIGCEKSIPVVTYTSILNDVHLIEITVGKDDPPLDLRFSHGDLKSPKIFEPIHSGFGAKILLYEDFDGEFLVSIHIKTSKYGICIREFSFRPPPTTKPPKKISTNKSPPNRILNAPSYLAPRDRLDLYPQVLYQRKWVNFDENGNSEVSQFITLELLEHVE